MKFVINILIFCFAASAANHAYPSDVNEIKCNDDLISLNFSNSVIRDIGENFISSPIITCLDLQYNQIEIIAEGAFNQLPNLTNLYLSSNKINPTNLFSFGSHEKLQVLRLDGNIKSVYPAITIIGTYPSLEILSVSRNGLRDLIGGSYSQYGESMSEMIFPKLKYLDLSQNHINGHKFVQLLPKSLGYLDLDGNSLYSLHLNNSKKLRVLILDNNKLSEISNSFFSIPENLESLSLSNNRIKKIEQNAFIKASKLSYLNLSSNGLHSIDSMILTHLQSLTTLDLSNNKLTVIPTPNRMSNINLLFLDGNEIMSILSNAFAKMPKLIELSLKNNQINETSDNSFANLHDLRQLDLSSNKLSSLPAGWTKLVTSLVHLDLSDNKFTSLESLSLTKEMSLLRLYLVNILKSFKVRSIENLPQSATVYLQR